VERKMVLIREAGERKKGRQHEPNGQCIPVSGSQRGQVELVARGLKRFEKGFHWGTVVRNGSR
jgi:hypothetical protein